MDVMKSSDRYLCEAIATLLREYRQEAGMKQDDVAKRLRKPQSYVSKVESCERRVDLIQLLRFLHLYGRSLVEFEKELNRAVKRESNTEEDMPRTV